MGRNISTRWWWFGLVVVIAGLAAPTQAQERARRPGVDLRAPGLASALAGLFATGLGVRLMLDRRAERARPPQRADVGGRLPGSTTRNMRIAFGAGAVALTAGGVLYALGHRAARAAPRTGPEPPPRAATVLGLTPIPIAGGGLLQVNGRF
ncbi:hypothetical protein [Haliangium sp.]|uniref:hypothetical protein n=1 Tax=Haliangium sp. TaxID=2663208 RepID=UPI003D12BC77